MNRHLKTLAAGTALVASLAAAPALFAQDYLAMRHDSTMCQGGMTGMMGSMMSSVMNVMGMSGDMGSMMGHCNAMMHGTDGQRPNDQWRTPNLLPEQESGASCGT